MTEIEMASSIRCAHCRMCLSLLSPPDPTCSGRDRARVVSPRRVLFSLFCHFFLNVYWYVQVYIRMISCDVRKLVSEQADCCL